MQAIQVVLSIGEHESEVSDLAACIPGWLLTQLRTASTPMQPALVSIIESCVTSPAARALPVTDVAALAAAGPRGAPAASATFYLLLMVDRVRRGHAPPAGGAPWVDALEASPVWGVLDWLHETTAASKPPEQATLACVQVLSLIHI